MKQSTIFATVALFFAGFAIAAPAPSPIHTSTWNPENGLNFINEKYQAFDAVAADVKLTLRTAKLDAEKYKFNADDKKKIDDLIETVESWKQGGAAAWSSATNNINDGGSVSAIVALLDQTLDTFEDEIKRIRALKLGTIITEAHFRAEREKLLGGKKW